MCPHCLSACRPRCPPREPCRSAGGGADAPAPVRAPSCRLPRARPASRERPPPPHPASDCRRRSLSDTAGSGSAPVRIMAAQVGIDEALRNDGGLVRRARRPLRRSTARTGTTLRQERSAWFQLLLFGCPTVWGRLLTGHGPATSKIGLVERQKSATRKIGNANCGSRASLVLRFARHSVAFSIAFLFAPRVLIRTVEQSHRHSMNCRLRGLLRTADDEPRQRAKQRARAFGVVQERSQASPLGGSDAPGRPRPRHRSVLR